MYVEDSFTLMRKFKEFQAGSEGASLGIPSFCMFFGVIIGGPETYWRDLTVYIYYIDLDGTRMILILHDSCNLIWVDTPLRYPKMQG